MQMSVYMKFKLIVKYNNQEDIFDRRYNYDNNDILRG